ncbi:MAG: ethylbenzene dehydrogenase-related protein [Thiogranum sp.]
MKTLVRKTAYIVTAIILLAPLLSTDTHARWGGGGGGGGGWDSGITAARVYGEVLLPPDDPQWNNATAQSFSLRFINSTEGGWHGGWDAGGDSGTGGTMTVKAIHNGSEIAFLLTWNDATRNDTVNGVEEFSDRAGIMFSAEQMCRMGSTWNPVNIWFWHASKGVANNLVAGGVGTVTMTGDDNISVISNYSNGQWQLVMSRPLAPINPDNQVDLSNGDGRIAFARWDGSNRERNGKKWITNKTSLSLQ